MANGHGGARSGTGPKPNAVKYAEPLAKANDHLAYELRECVKALLELALGTTEEVERVPAGLLWRKDVLRLEPRTGGFTDPDGRECDARGVPLPPMPDDLIWRDEKGKPAVVDVPMFPNLDPDELVVVKRKKLRPDVKALAYIWDRLEGRANYVPAQDPQTLDILDAVIEARKALAARRANPRTDGPPQLQPPPPPVTVPTEAASDDGDD